MRVNIKVTLLFSFLLFLLFICHSQNQANSQDFLKKYLNSALIKKGKQYKSDGNYPSAITKFTKSIKKDPENVEAYYQLGLIFEEVMLDYDNAISLYNSVILLSESVKLRDKAISPYDSVILLPEGVKQAGNDEKLNVLNTLITNAKTSIDRAIRKKFESIAKPKIPIYIVVKPFKRILKDPKTKMFSTSKYKPSIHASEFKLLNFSDNWYQMNVPSIGSGWVIGNDVSKIIQKEIEAIETSPEGKVALYGRFVDLYPDCSFAADAKARIDELTFPHAKYDNNIKSLESSNIKNNIVNVEKKVGEIISSQAESSKQSPVYTTKSSIIYHKRNCPELNSNDLVEFESSQKADSADAIPCKHCCNPSPVVEEKILESRGVKPDGCCSKQTIST